MNNTSTNYWLSWLRLVRASALPSAIANILVGFLWATNGWIPVDQLLLLVLCSGCLYSSGMVLNDICDLETDKQINPERPIPANEISKSGAWIGYISLTCCGIILAFFAGLASLILALAIVFSILMYDWVFKKTAVGPVFMGCCRTLNILLGGSMGLGTQTQPEFPVLLLLYAISIGVLVAGLTYMGRNERQIISQHHVTKSAFLMLFGGACLFVVCFCGTQTMIVKAATAVLLAAVMYKPLRQSFTVASKASPECVRAAVIATLKSFILIDAVFCLLIAPEKFYFAILVALLIVPAKTLGRWISST